MNVNTTNAAVVAAIFKALADPRFTMRTPGAMTEGGTVEISKVIDVAAEIGIRTLHRRRDGAALLQRPCTVEQATQIATQALGIVAGTHEPFDVDFSAHEEASIEPGAAASNADGFEDC